MKEKEYVERNQSSIPANSFAIAPPVGSGDSHVSKQYQFDEVALTSYRRINDLFFYTNNTDRNYTLQKRESNETTAIIRNWKDHYNNLRIQIQVQRQEDK